MKQSSLRELWAVESEIQIRGETAHNSFNAGYLAALERTLKCLQEAKEIIESMTFVQSETVRVLKQHAKKQEQK